MFSKTKGKQCPLLKKECQTHSCAWYAQIAGTNPQTGDPVNHYDCTVSLLPLLLIENSQQQRQTGAAVESLRNETLKAACVTQQILLSNDANTLVAYKEM